MRGRNAYLSDVFFGTAGTTTVPPTSDTPPTSPIKPPLLEPTDPSQPVLPLAPELQPNPDAEIAPTTPTTTDPLIHELQEIKDVLQTKPYHPTYINYPIWTPRPYVLIDDTTGQEVIVGQPPVYTGGGSGGGYVEEYEEETTGDEMVGSGKIAQPVDNKKKILWLILIAVALYLGYRYWKKNK